MDRESDEAKALEIVAANTLIESIDDDDPLCAAIASALKAAREEEREACAKIAESRAIRWEQDSDHHFVDVGRLIAAAIRERAQSSMTA